MALDGHPPWSLFYVILVHLWLVLESNLVSSTYLILLRFFYIFPCVKTPVFVFWYLLAHLTLLGHLIHHLGLLAHLYLSQWPAYCLEVVVLATFSTLPSVCRALLGWVPYATILVFVTMFCKCARWHQNLWPLCYCLTCFFLCFLELRLLLISHQWSHHYLAHLWTALLIIYQAPYIYTQLLLCAVCPSIPGQTHCFFCAISCIETKTMIQLWHGLNLLLSTENIPFVVLHFFFSYCIKVSMSNSPFQPSQFFTTCILSSSFILYPLVSNIFIIQFGNLTVHDTCLAHPSSILVFPAWDCHFCSLWFSHLFGILAAQGPVSVSVNTTMTTVAACTATTIYYFFYAFWICHFSSYAMHFMPMGVAIDIIVYDLIGQCYYRHSYILGRMYQWGKHQTLIVTECLLIY